MGADSDQDVDDTFASLLVDNLHDKNATVSQQYCPTADTPPTSPEQTGNLSQTARLNDSLPGAADYDSIGCSMVDNMHDGNAIVS